MPDPEKTIDPSAFVFGEGDTLDRFDPADTGPFDSEEEAEQATQEGARRLARRQLMLEAHGTHGLLVIFEGMDAAGKDEAIHHVMGAVDPNAASAEHFASPNEDEARHDYLRRAALALPARGEMGIFNRSYYGQVLGDRVDPDHLDAQCLPDEVRAQIDDGSIWDERLRQIRDWERYLVENGIHLVKLFFHVSNEAQRRRLLERIERPEKRWDFSRADVEKRRDWDRFMEAHEAAFRATSAEHAPWHIIPADRKWFGRAAAAAVILDKLRHLHDDFPEPDEEQAEVLRWGKEQLEQE